MKVFGKLATALACTTALAGAAHAAPYQRQPGVDVEHYVFNVELADGTHLIKGETVTTVRFKQPGVDKVVFELKARDAKGLGMTVAGVTDARTGQPVKFTHQGEQLTLQLPAAPRPGETRDFRIRYSGEPEDGLTFGTSRAGGRVFVTWNWPTKIRDWAPTLDHPSSKVTSEWIVTAPEQYSVVANGLMESEISLGDGRKTTHWRQSVPIAAWLNAFQVARFQTWYGGTARGIPLQLWAPVGTKVDVENGFLVAHRTIDFFGDVIGPYPFEKLGQVAAPLLGGGAMEHASVVFYGDGGTPDGKPTLANRRGGEQVAMASHGVMAHEIAHQWFGDSVTEASWGDVWLSEGFATYFSDLYTEHYDGRDAFVASLKGERTRALAAERKERDPVITALDDSAGPDLSQVQYAKGGWVLHMMREQLGAPTFFKGIKLYYARHHGGHATTDDLRRAMEDASGQDLKWFFDQWLTRVDSPKLDVKWSYDDAAKVLKVSVTQQQAGDAYRLPIEIGVADAPRGALTVLKVDMDKKSQTFSLPLAKAPADVVLDPETKLLADMALAQG